MYKTLKSQVRCCHAFVPKHNPICENDVQLLKNFINNYERILVLTGAGISTESGIPDYRSEGVGLYARTNHKPMLYQEFLKSEASRQRYWARNFVGWTKFSSRQPNENHKAIKTLESTHRKLTTVVTQNVDNLHYKAGSKSVIELHGSAFRVLCLSCRKVYSRDDIQSYLQDRNNHFPDVTTMIRPDGDVDIPDNFIKSFVPPICTRCQGVLKPDIVFFGDNVPKDRVENVKRQVSSSDAVLVLGSSLTVFSAYRIILQAVEEKKALVAVNIGATRADKYLDLKISAKCGDVLPLVVNNII